MKNKKTTALVVAATLGGMIIGQTLPAEAQFGSILKGGGLALLVSKFGPQIDRFINTLTGNKTGGGQATKVVPIITLGGGTFVGAVQVSGPAEEVGRTQAVAEVEGNARPGGKLFGDIRVRGLIPIATKSASDTNSLNRVKGVGVSALIEAKL